MKKPLHQRLGDWIEGRGFYIVLLLCVAAIGLSGWYLFSSFSPPAEEGTPVGGSAQITVTPSPRPSVPAQSSPIPLPSAPAATPGSAAAPAALPSASATPAAAPSASPASTPAAALSAPSSWLWPVRGEILTAYTGDELAYDLTMADWRAHTGVDIAASAGTQVVAAAGGVVTAVEQDVMMGSTVTVDHGGGYTAVYANLAGLPTVEAGQQVLAGDVLGSVGNTAIAESALPAHLHFSLRLDGLPTDPLPLLGE